MEKEEDYNKISIPYEINSKEILIYDKYKEASRKNTQEIEKKNYIVETRCNKLKDDLSEIRNNINKIKAKIEQK